MAVGSALVRDSPEDPVCDSPKDPAKTWRWAAVPQRPGAAAGTPPANRQEALGEVPLRGGGPLRRGARRGGGGGQLGDWRRATDISHIYVYVICDMCMSSVYVGYARAKPKQQNKIQKSV